MPAAAKYVTRHHPSPADRQGQAVCLALGLRAVGAGHLLPAGRLRLARPDVHRARGAGVRPLCVFIF